MSAIQSLGPDFAVANIRMNLITDGYKPQNMIVAQGEQTKLAKIYLHVANLPRVETMDVFGHDICVIAVRNPADKDRILGRLQHFESSRTAPKTPELA